MKTPRYIYITTGKGRHQSKIGSFEYALRDASIEKYNHVEVSSIVPPNASKIDKKELQRKHNAGEITPTVFARKSTNNKEKIKAGIAASFTKNKHGYIIEQIATDNTDPEKTARDISRELTTGEITEIVSRGIEAEGKNNEWTTVVAAVMLI